MKNNKLLVLLVFLFTGYCFSSKAQVSFLVADSLFTIKADDLRDFFSYSSGKVPLISAHRGGPREGFPENCLETFENTLKHTPALLEIDPRYTKDGEIVLMHDATLDRTSNGHGKVVDHTLADLKKLRLKDTDGNVTNFQIPTLDEALQWSKGKTILVIDAKDVPMEIRVKKILENNAEAHALVIAYSMEDIKTAHRLSPKILMEVMMGKIENVKTMDDSGIPWKNMVGFIGHDLPVKQALIEELHQRGVMCIQGSSRNYDQQFIQGDISKQQLIEGYKEIVGKGVDIIEADLGIESGEAILIFQNIESSRESF